MSDTYRCDHCEGEFITGWTEAEAVAEYEQNFGNGFNRVETGVLCDDCYKKFLAWFEEEKKAGRL